MTTRPLPSTDATRIAGWLSALLVAATATFLQDAYQRLPLLVPVEFEAGNPTQFAFKSPALIYLPVGLQVAMGVVFLAIVVLLLRRSVRVTDNEQPAAARHAAEAIAFLAVVWIAFQGVNAWRLVSLYSRTYDTDIELYGLAIVTAITATITIAARALLQARELDDHEPGGFVAEPGQPLATAVLAALVGVGIAVPLYLVATVWEGLRHI